MGVAVTGEMLAAVADATQQQAMIQALGQQGHHAGVRMEGSIADDAGGVVIQVQYRSETQVHAHGAQFGADRVADLGGLAAGRQHVAIPQPAQVPHRGDRAEALAEALHSPAFVVDADQQLRAAQRMDFRRHVTQLRRRVVVAREQDDSTHQGMTQTLAFRVGQRQAVDVGDDRPQGQLQRCRSPAQVSHQFFSRITNASALAFSSDNDTCAVRSSSSRYGASALRATG